MPRQDNDWARYTPVDNTNDSYNVFQSAFKNIKFAVLANATYQVNEHDMANLPGIAFATYGDVSMWDCILRFNGLSDAIQDVYPGLVLNLPNKANVLAYLSSQQANTPVVITI